MHCLWWLIQRCNIWSSQSTMPPASGRLEEIWVAHFHGCYSVGINTLNWWKSRIEYHFFFFSSKPISFASFSWALQFPASLKLVEPYDSALVNRMYTFSMPGPFHFYAVLHSLSTPDTNLKVMCWRSTTRWRDRLGLWITTLRRDAKLQWTVM